jgi:hypothetical protein
VRLKITAKQQIKIKHLHFFNASQIFFVWAIQPLFSNQVPKAENQSGLSNLLSADISIF